MVRIRMDSVNTSHQALPARRFPSPKTVLAVFVVALVIRAAFVAVHPAPPFKDDMITYEGIAKNIVDGKWHFGWDDEPSAHREPIYPLFVAGIYKVFGESRAAVHWIQAIVGAGTCALACLMAGYLVRSRYAALLCGLMASVYPPFLLDIQTILSETLATFILLAAMLLVVIGWREERRAMILWGGVLLGLATLTRSASLMYVPILAFGILVFMPGRRVARLATAAALCAVFLAVLSPWMIRNYVVFNRFIPVGVNGGIVLFYGNYNGPKPDPKIEALVEGKDEVERDRFLMHRGIQLFRNDPAGFILGCFKKLPRFWLNVGFDTPPSRASVVFAFGNGFLLALALWGIFRSKLIDHRAAAPVYALILYFTLLHMILIALGRYSVPLMPYVLAFSSAGVLGLAGRFMPVLRVVEE
jgi:4-amino-4-deoxy-L-arabinose transferase-like glycosyltransferase